MSLVDVQIRAFMLQMLDGLREDVSSGDIPYEHTPGEGVVMLCFRSSGREKATGQDVHGVILVAVSEQKDVLDMLERAWPKSGGGGAGGGREGKARQP